MQEAVSSHNLFLTRSKLCTKFVLHVYYMTLQCIGGNATSIMLLGDLVLLLWDLMATATWLANPSLLTIFFLMV